MKWMPWRIALVAIAGWMNRQQQDVIAYLTAENRILREQLGPKRLILNESQKRRLARAAFALGRNVLAQIGTLFSPDTLLKWYRTLIARKYDGAGSRSKPGPEPTKAKQIRDHVIRMTTESPDWGYGRIHGELLALGFDVSWQTVRRIMLDLGLLPDPDKPYKTTWNQFIKSHFQSIAACDFFAVETLGLKGLTRWLVFFVIDISTRCVHIAGIHHDPAEPQMLQMARNLTDCEDGFLKGKRILIHDRDPLFTEKFRDTLRAVGVRSLKLPKQSPNLNPYSESFVRTIKRECLDKMILVGERHMRYVISEFMLHYLEERPHQGLGNKRLSQPETPPPKEGKVVCCERLGGLLKSYHRQAA